MFGPSVVLVGLSIGSGEFVLWPRLTVEWGFALFWACWTGVTLQFFLNMEIERWTLATGGRPHGLALEGPTLWVNSFAGLFRVNLPTLRASAASADREGP